MKYPIFFAVALLTTAMARAEATDPRALIDTLNRHQNLEPLFQTLDTRALADSAGLEERTASLLEKLKPRLKTDGLKRADLAAEAAGVTLRLEFAGGNLNYLTLQQNDDGELAGWYDYALGVSLSDLVRALADRGSGARDLMQQLEQSPLQALGGLPDERDGRILSRLVLAACGGKDCYTRALAQMQPLEPVRASLWRYEQAVQATDEARADEALEDLRAELGHDPGLIWLNAARALSRENCAAVRDELEQALQHWPDYRKLYPVAAQCAARERDWSATTRWFRQLEQRFGQRLDFEALEDHPDYGDYIESDSFREWQQQ